MILENVPVRVHCRLTEGNSYMLRYSCPQTGAFRSVPKRKSGVFETKTDALKWAAENIGSIVQLNESYFSRQKWRLNSKILKMYNEYSAWRKSEYERSARYDLSVISTYIFPFFINHQGLNDPNTWGRFGEEFTSWLRNDARTKEGRPLAEGTISRIVSAANQLLKWMRRKKFIDYENYRPVELMRPRNYQRRNYRDLISDKVFKAVHEYLVPQNELYADMWYVQRWMGFRVNELLGLSFNWLSDWCPAFISEEFESKGLTIYGSILLESQLANPWIVRRENVDLPRAPLKGRMSIGSEYSRTIPILDSKLWEILVRRYDEQMRLWSAKIYGETKENYLLFNGAQAEFYRGILKDAFASMGLVSTGTHILRHTVSTEWTELKISEKVSELVLGHKSAAHERYVHIVAKVNAERSKARPLPRLRKNVEN